MSFSTLSVRAFVAIAMWGCAASHGDARGASERAGVAADAAAPRNAARPVTATDAGEKRPGANSDAPGTNPSTMGGGDVSVTRAASGAPGPDAGHGDQPGARISDAGGAAPCVADDARAGVAVAQLEQRIEGLFPPNYYTDLGASIALDHDTFAIGSPRPYNGETQLTSVFVLTRNGSAWTQEAVLKPEPEAAPSDFGRALALSGDTLAVGAPVAFNDGNDQHGVGRVSVFVREGTSWSLQATLTAREPQPDDAFGAHLALDGNRLAVSVIDASVRVDHLELFERVGTTWQSVERIDPMAAGSSEGRIADIALDGDVLAFGMVAPNDPAQAAHVFVRRDGKFEPEVMLQGDLPVELFGASVALRNGILVVGDPWQGQVHPIAAEAGLPFGSAYVFERDCSQAWVQRARLKGSFPASGVGFGSSVAVEGDRIMVGNPADTSPRIGIDGAGGTPAAPDSYVGAVYVFARGNGYAFLNQIKPTRDAITSINPRFGHALAASAGRIAVAAQAEQSAYLYR